MLKPFVKWAGGKKQILAPILEKINDSKKYGNRDDFTFIEPFVGGGVTFLALQHNNVIINDLNRELMITYKVIRNNPEELKSRLDEMYKCFQANEDDYYYAIRNLDRDETYKSMSDLEIASRMIFLNKTCFNGLYRVNSEGFFNTPKGKGKRIGLYDERNINALSKYLKTIPEQNIMNGSYKCAMRKAVIGDIVYIDPPYDYTENDGFTKYQKEGFSFEDLKELKKECDDCLDREAFVVISNNDTKKVRETFRPDEEHHYTFYVIDKLDTKRLINCKSSLRNTGKEIIIWGIPCKFAQVKDVTKLISYITIKNSSDIKNPEVLKKRFKVTKARTFEILASLQYFGFVDFDGNFSEKAQIIRKTKKTKRNCAMKNYILEIHLFNKVYNHDMLDTGNKYTIEEISFFVKEEKPQTKDKIALKRARIIRDIIDWCLAN